MLAPCIALAQGAEPSVRRAADRLAAQETLANILPSLPCLLSPEARHLEELPSLQPWVRPEAVVVMEGLPGQPEEVRGALVRATRALLARQQVQSLLAERRAVALTRDLDPPLPGDSTPFLLLLAPLDADPDTAPDTCIPRGSR